MARALVFFSLHYQYNVGMDETQPRDSFYETNPYLSHAALLGGGLKGLDLANYLSRTANEGLHASATTDPKIMVAPSVIKQTFGPGMLVGSDEVMQRYKGLGVLDPFSKIYSDQFSYSPTVAQTVGRASRGYSEYLAPHADKPLVGPIISRLGALNDYAKNYLHFKDPLSEPMVYPNALDAQDLSKMKGILSPFADTRAQGTTA